MQENGKDNILKKKKKLGDVLVEQGVITNDQLMEALAKQKVTKSRLGATLIEMGIITELEIAKALQQQFGFEFVSLSGIKIPDDVINLITDTAILKKNTMMPFEFDQGDMSTLRVAMADPLDIFAIDDLSIITNTQIQPVIGTTTDIMAAIDRYYGNKDAQAVAEQYTREREKQYIQKQQEEETNNEDVEKSPIVILVKTIIEQAARQRASDIHIEPLENRVRLRYRVDGVLHEISSYDNNLLQAIVARIKIVGGMDISEKRKPQDGRITQVVDKVEYDIRVSILPTVYGEKIVMRLTAKHNLTRDKKLLGFNEEELKRFDAILSNPHGIILVTGPTGSGKSTTLYTALSELNREDVNIITVEDPVEANIDGVNQVQVNTKANLTFASALRSILRQDPDIIMIGEIRDEETARIAVTASITGHLVVSTLHTNSSINTITRLEDMGIESYLIADSVVGIIAQRLVRRLCTCKKIREATDSEKIILGKNTFEKINIFEPCGCAKCNDTGYAGRIGVYEILTVSNAIKNAISNKKNTDDILDIALSEGMSTLRMSATKLVLDGVTSINEMKRITYDNE